VKHETQSNSETGAPVDSDELKAALHVAVLALTSIRHEAKWTIQQAKILDIAIERGARALGKDVQALLGWLHGIETGAKVSR
jgi:hypothetical protein